MEDGKEKTGGGANLREGSERQVQFDTSIRWSHGDAKEAKGQAVWSSGKGLAGDRNTELWHWYLEPTGWMRHRESGVETALNT